MSKNVKWKDSLFKYHQLYHLEININPGKVHHSACSNGFTTPALYVARVRPVLNHLQPNHPAWVIKMPV